MLDAAALAAILDPERKVPGWWSYPCPKCAGVKGYDRYPHPNWCPGELGRTFTGPPDLHTAREHCWRMEEWLEARGIGWIRHMTETLPAMTCVMVGHGTENPSKVCNPNHAAAIAEAVRRVNDGQK